MQYNNTQESVNIPLNGYTSNNPFGLFQQDSKIHQNFSNFNESFRQYDSIIERNSTKNTGYSLLYQNIRDDIMNERVTEYKINIDSKDRDISVYPDPFDFFTYTFCSSTKFNYKRI